MKILNNIWVAVVAQNGVIDSKNRKTIIVNSISAIIVILTQVYLIIYYSRILPFVVIIINIVSLLSYFGINLFGMFKAMKLEQTSIALEQEKLYNKTLQILHDDLSAFRHDFSNILSGIGGYIKTNDLEGLKKYYSQLQKDCSRVKNLGSLNPNSINNPAVFSVLANKYYKADNLGIKINLETFIDFNNLHMEIYEFTRILGILMDNAIEACAECNNKLINVTIKVDPYMNRELLIIENTYEDKSINIDQIYEKGFSTKPKNTGLGLWEVDNILKKHKNLTRFTTKSNEFFKQQIEIYNE